MTLSKCPNVDVFGLGPVTPRSKRAHDHETEHHPAALLAALLAALHLFWPVLAGKYQDKGCSDVEMSVMFWQDTEIMRAEFEVSCDV